MLKKISLVVVFIMAVFLVAGQLPVYAKDTLSITGKVKDVDLDDKSIVLGTETGDQVFYIEETTQILSGKTAKELKDITIGMVIEILYNTSGDDNIVFKINIVS